MTRAHLYLGRAGQLAAMAEFLARGYNVAIPEVDVGDDILVVRDQSGEFHRVQVKSCEATNRNYGYSGSYHLGMAQLETPTAPETWYVFVARFEQRWDSFLVISREQLYDLHELHGIGSRAGEHINLYIAYKEGETICSGQDLQGYIENWGAWPIIKH